jgi:hypothetical protein
MSVLFKLDFQKALDPLIGFGRLIKFGCVPVTVVVAFPERADVASFVEAAVTSQPLELCWFRGGCHWETASEMILVVAEAIRGVGLCLVSEQMLP